MQALLKLSRGIDAVNTRIGRWLAWLILVAVIVSSVNATVRKIFDVSSNAYLELQWVLFGIVFLLCSPWTLIDNEHIRIDIVNHSLPLKVRSWIDLIGHIFFLLPFTIIMMWDGVPFFLTSFEQNEQSLSAGGLPQWPTKSLIMIAAALLFIQAISEIIKRVAIMRGVIPDPNARTISAQEAAELEAARLAAEIANEKPAH